MPRQLTLSAAEELVLACAALAFTQRLDAAIAQERASPEPDETGLAGLQMMREEAARLADRLLATGPAKNGA